MDVTFATLQRNRCFVVKMSGNVHSVREWWRRLSFFTVNLYTFVHFSRLWVQTVDKSMQIYRCNLKSFFFRIAKYMVLDIFQTKSGHFIREWWMGLFFFTGKYAYFCSCFASRGPKSEQTYAVLPLKWKSDFTPLERNGQFWSECVQYHVFYDAKWLRLRPSRTEWPVSTYLHKKWTFLCIFSSLFWKHPFWTRVSSIFRRCCRKICILDERCEGFFEKSQKTL